MAEIRAPHPPRASAAGFTLVEMMAAVGILAFGMSALIGVLSAGVSGRRNAEAQSRAVALAGHVLFELEERYLRAPRPGDPPPADLAVDRVDGYPGMRYTVRFVADEEHPELILARVRVQWRQQGEVQSEEFQRILPLHESYSVRVGRLRPENG
ncbi:MAG: type II secretion system protein [Planctomycetes bacterium]|nr:type II secretion system protein [Planctomycetota bacterium]